MTNYNDRNSQIRAKNLFEEETPKESSEQQVTEEKNVQSIRNGVMKNMAEQGKKTPGNLSAGNTAGQNKAAGGTGNKSKAANGVRKSAAEGKSGQRGAAVAAKRTSAPADTKNKGKKSPRQRQEAQRFYTCIIMAVFVLFVMGWGVCQLIRTINKGESQSMVMVQPGEQVVDNSANAGKTMDVDKFVSKMLDSVTFEAELNPLEDSVASGMIETTEGTDLRVYMGNGTYSDELVVMTALSEADAEKNQKSAETHLAEMQKQFKDYIPKEAKKIDNAIKVRCGCYVVVCVTNDTETAKKTIDTFMKDKQ